MNNEGDLSVWWIPQIPGEPFRVKVESPSEAIKIMNVLADYDLFQLHNNIKPDYANDGGLDMFEDGEWITWHNRHGEDIEDVIRNEFQSKETMR